MESKYYNAKQISEMTGYSINKAYQIIKDLNVEINYKYKDVSENERPLIFNGRVLKSYFDKKCEVNYEK